jgi:hypothetical protein
MLRVLLVAAFAALLPACAMAKPNPLPLDVRQSLFIKDVSLDWNLKKPPTNPDDPAYVAYRQDFEARIKNVVAEAFSKSPAGSEAAAFKLEVTDFSAATTGAFMAANVTVTRVSDGAVLGVYPKVRGFQSASGGGLLGVLVQAMVKPDVIGIMSNNFAAVLRAKFDAKK